MIINDLTKPRNHKVKSDYGLQDYYKYYKKLGGTSSYKVYSSVIRDINKMIGKYLIANEYTYRIPCELGGITVKKIKFKISYKHNRLYTNTPVNWVKTMELWEKYPEKFRKTLIRYENKHTSGYRYEFSYLIGKAKYNGKSVYKMRFNRQLKRSFKDYLFENGHVERGLKYL